MTEREQLIAIMESVKDNPDVFDEILSYALYLVEKEYREQITEKEARKNVSV